MDGEIFTQSRFFLLRGSNRRLPRSRLFEMMPKKDDPHLCEHDTFRGERDREKERKKERERKEEIERKKEKEKERESKKKGGGTT